jgi:hypothetical protein
VFEFSVGKDIKKEYNKGVGNREGSGTSMSNINYQGIEI